VVSPSPSISDVSDVNSLVAFYDIHGKGCYSFVPSRTPHETHWVIFVIIQDISGINDVGALAHVTGDRPDTEQCDRGSDAAGGRRPRVVLQSGTGRQGATYGTR
jgi:hypothetical protein